MTKRNRRIRAGALIFGLMAGMAGAAYALRVLTSVEEVRPTSPVRLASLKPASPGPLDWPWWRGVHGDNVAVDAHPPLQWTKSTGVIWKVEVPGQGHASPVIWGDRVFLFSSEDASQEQFLLCLSRETGSLLWRTSLHHGGFMTRHPKNTQASSTPACDGEQVYVAALNSDAVRVSAVKMDGSLAWQVEAGPYVSEWGYASSVVLDGGLVYVVGDNAGFKFGRIRATSFLAALRRDTGEIVWRIRRPEDRSYGTPLPATFAGRPQVVMAGPRGIFGYDAGTGEEIWFSRWDAARTASSPARWRDNLIATALSVSTNTRETICVRGDGSGEVWRLKSTGADVPSPLVVGDRLYIADDRGIVTCLDAASGKTRWKQRVGGTVVSSSPVYAGGYIYWGDEGGDVYVFKDADRFEPVSRNSLEEALFSSPAVSGDRLFLRTEHHLWCLGAR